MTTETKADTVLQATAVEPNAESSSAAGGVEPHPVAGVPSPSAGGIGPHALSQADPFGDWKASLFTLFNSAKTWRDKQLEKLGQTNTELLKEYALLAVYMFFVFMVKAITIAVLWNGAGRNVFSGEDISIRTALSVVLIWALM